jgi:hypothetical protein
MLQAVAIAHRGVSAASVKKAQVVDYFGFIKRLAGKTVGFINRHVHSISGVYLYDD